MRDRMLLKYYMKAWWNPNSTRSAASDLLSTYSFFLGKGGGRSFFHFKFLAVTKFA